MKKLTYLLLLLIPMIYTACKGKVREQKSPKRKIHSKAFNWSIIIPENFEKVSSKDWAKMQNKGADAIEKTYGEEVINKAKTIFVFKSDVLNYIEACYQPFDSAVDGDYRTSFYNIHEVLYQTFVAQIPGVRIDTASAIEKIDDKEFLLYKMDIKYPNNLVMHSYMYNKLLGKRDFTVNIYYVDSVKGQQLLSAWKNSKFGK